MTNAKWLSRWLYDHEIANLSCGFHDRNSNEYKIAESLAACRELMGQVLPYVIANVNLWGKIEKQLAGLPREVPSPVPSAKEE